MGISHEEVERIVRLLDASQFHELTLEADGMKLTLRRGASAPVEAAAVAATTPKDRKPPTREPFPTAATNPVSQAAAQTPRADANFAAIRAPMLGTFYRAPKPGAEPFVDIGTRVDADTVIGVIEVMKLMNSVPAGLRGEIVDVFARDGELVEYEQVLMRVRPL